ncbi:unnamed protein product [Zymoseptoria tritici ST99CH_3D1]|nr:unnamed protein product [Zymoseptoria tritici ST99CH_3D1]
MIASAISPTAAAVVALVIFFIVLVARGQPDRREPPHLTPRVPLVGHALGILCYGVPYYAKIAHQTSAPIFTLDLLVNRLYVVNSARMVAAVQKSHKIIAFDPFLTAAANRMAGINGPGLRLLQETQAGGKGVNQEVLHAMIPTMLGSGLDQMNRTMLRKLGPLLDDMIKDAPKTLDLHQWCQRTITTASSEAIWGSKNPFRSEKVREDFWYFESHLSILLAKIFPSVLARKAYLARETVVKAMLEFAKSGGYDDEACSELAIARRNTQVKAGASDHDIARLETALNIGVLSNTVPSTFWTLFDIYSRPQLLQQVRSEIEENAVVVDPMTNVHSIDLGAIRGSCPIFVSAFQESLRVHSNGAPTRMVYEDVVLDGSYLLKAGSVLQMSAPSINSEQRHWGKQAADYDPVHFQKDAADVPANKPRATSFMSFGASPNICPGRHFAAAEILSVVAMLLMRVDMIPVKGYWWTPRLNAWAIAASMTPPIEEYPVKIGPRKEVQGIEWDFVVSGKKDRFELITG